MDSLICKATDKKTSVVFSHYLALQMLETSITLQGGDHSGPRTPPSSANLVHFSSTTPHGYRNERDCPQWTKQVEKNADKWKRIEWKHKNSQCYFSSRVVKAKTSFSISTSDSFFSVLSFCTSSHVPYALNSLSASTNTLKFKYKHMYTKERT